MENHSIEKQEPVEIIYFEPLPSRRWPWNQLTSWRFWVREFLRLVALAFVIVTSYGLNDWDWNGLGAWKLTYFAVLGMWVGMVVEITIRGWEGRDHGQTS